jgi:outer membrane biosynthesis protein TonB
MSEAIADLAAGRQRDFRRMVGLSAALHVALSVAAIVTLPNPFANRELPAGAPDVEIITPEQFAAMTGAPKPAAKPKPAEPKPEPVAAPEPPPPPPDQIVISEDRNQKPANPEKKPRETPKPRAQEEPQVDLDDLLTEQQILNGRMPGDEKPAAKPQARPGAGGAGAPVSPEVLAWQKKVRAYADRNWGLTPGLRGKGLKTLVKLNLTASGVVLDYDVTRSSGNPWFDDSVEHFLGEAGSLPAPPSSGEWPIEFNGDF